MQIEEFNNTELSYGGACSHEFINGNNSILIFVHDLQSICNVVINNKHLVKLLNLQSAQNMPLTECIIGVNHSTDKIIQYTVQSQPEVVFQAAVVLNMSTYEMLNFHTFLLMKAI